MFKKKEKIEVEFISMFPGISELEDIKPVPSNKIIPKWWINTPYYRPEDNQYRTEEATVRQCPAFPDFLGSGFIIKMWADTSFRYNRLTDSWEWRCGGLNSPFFIQYIKPERFLNHVDYNFNGKKISGVFQMQYPYQIVTDKKYSLMQLPLYYNNTDTFTVLPGVFDAGISMQNVLDIAIFEGQDEIFIKRGTPLAQFIPYEKKKFTLNFRNSTLEDEKQHNANMMKRYTIFKNWYAENRIR